MIDAGALSVGRGHQQRLSLFRILIGAVQRQGAIHRHRHRRPGTQQHRRIVIGGLHGDLFAAAVFLPIQQIIPAAGGQQQRIRQPAVGGHLDQKIIAEQILILQPVKLQLTVKGDRHPLGHGDTGDIRLDGGGLHLTGNALPQPVGVFIRRLSLGIVLGGILGHIAAGAHDRHKSGKLQPPSVEGVGGTPVQCADVGADHGIAGGAEGDQRPHLHG